MDKNIKTSKPRRKQPKRQPKSKQKCSMEVQKNVRSISNSVIPPSLGFKFSELNYVYEATPSTDVFFHDEYMQNFYTFYPEFICIDVLTDVPEINKSLVFFIALDTNGHCEIISVGLINCENEQGLRWLCDMFKEHNSSWTGLKLVLCDEICNKKVLKAAFPEKLIFTSFYHLIKAFKDDLSNLDKAEDNQDVNKTTEIFAKMMFVTTDSEYVELLSQMKKINTRVFNWFKKRWHTQRDRWTLGLHTDSKIFLKAFNTCLQSIRKKVRPMVRSQETLEKVVSILHTVISKMRKEFFSHFPKMFHLPQASYLKIDIMKNYSTILTPFATELIFEQLNNTEIIENPQKIDGQSYYRFSETLASSNSCSCNFQEFVKLPCCHILSVRKYLLQSQFIQSVRSSWIFENYRDNFFTLYSLHLSDQEETKAAEMRHRYEEFVRISHELWHLMLNCPPKQSQERLETYMTILRAWKSGFDVEVIRSKPRNESLPDSIESEGVNLAVSFTELYGISVDDIANAFSDLPVSADSSLEGIDI